MENSEKLEAPALLQAAIVAMKDRAASRDAPDGERSIPKAVAIFNAARGKKLSVIDGCIFMVCLKMARGSQGKYRADDYIDLAAYSALAGEAAAVEGASEGADADGSMLFSEESEAERTQRSAIIDDLRLQICDTQQLIDDLMASPAWKDGEDDSR